MRSKRLFTIKISGVPAFKLKYSVNKSSDVRSSGLKLLKYLSCISVRNDGSKIITINESLDVLDRIEKLVKDGWFISKGEFYRFAILFDLILDEIEKNQSIISPSPDEIEVAVDGEVKKFKLSKV